MKKALGGIVVLVAVVVVSVFLLRSGGPPPEEAPVRIAYLPTSSCLPLFVALENGYFTEAGVQVEPIKFTGTNDALNAVLAGRADGTPGFGLSSFYAIEANSPGALKVYMPCVEDADNYASSILVPVDSPVNAITELAGRRVGTYVSSTQMLYLKLMMAQVLPEGQEWEIVQVDRKLELQALTAGQFDALFTLEPNVTKAVSEGLARVLVPSPRTKYILDPFPAGANCFSAEFLATKPKAAAAVMAAFARAVSDIRSRPDAARLVLPRYTPIDEALAPDVGLYTWWLAGEEDFQALQHLADLLVAEGLIKGPVDIRSMYWAAGDI